MIPKIIHFIWIGNIPFPENMKKYIDEFKIIYYDYDFFFWDNQKVENENIVPENFKDIYEKNPFHVAFKVDLLRYFILKKYGGLYFDTDFQPITKLPDRFLEYDFLGGIQNNGEVAIGFIGSSPENKIINMTINSIPSSIDEAKNNNYYINGYIYKITGPEFFNKIVRRFSEDSSVFLFSPENFYPYAWWEKVEKEHLKYPNAIAVHHWSLSWWENKK